MAIMKFKPDVDQPATEPNLPRIEPKKYDSIVNDDKSSPINSLIAYIEGAPWICNYYSQVVTKHNDLREIDPGQPNIYQQYQEIKGLEIRVSSPLSNSYDADTGITTVIGNGILYPFIVPNISDYFVTDAGIDRKGLYRITNTERKTFNRDSAFYIDYELVGYIDVLTDVYDDLLSKVTRHYVFDKDRLVDGSQPVLKTEEYNQLTSLKSLYKDIVAYYFKTFFNRSYMTLMLPGQETGIYDSLLVNYLMKIVDSFDAYEIRNVKQVPTDNDRYLAQNQFWEIMLNKDYSSLDSCNQFMGIANKYIFNKNAFLHGVIFSNIDYLVYPVTPDVTSQIDENPNSKVLSIVEMIQPTNVHGTLADMIADQYITPNAVYPLIKTVTTDDYYVLSEPFYTGTTGLSLLEIMTKDYLKKQTLDLPQLLALCGKYKTWGRLEQFYYGPILLTLIKEADRGVYS